MANVPGTDNDSRLHLAAESLQVALDDLWTRYLSLLDKYQCLRQELAKEIANVSHQDIPISVCNL